MWTPIVKRYATLNELKNVYTFEDVLDMHEVIITLAKEEQETAKAPKK
ncbi:hypothetical protein [Campylobacter sp.]|nr:hypothetical protein [Campylobacter sp.]MDU6827754.1 hypothetical protein [Campylobacter sp.]